MLLGFRRGGSCLLQMALGLCQQVRSVLSGLVCLITRGGCVLSRLLCVGCMVTGHGRVLFSNVM